MSSGHFTSWRFGVWRFGAWHFIAGALAGGYALYRGLNAPEAIDWDTQIAWASAGETEAVSSPGVTWTDGVTYYVGCRAVSAAGVVETHTDRICRVLIVGGQLAGPAPNPIFTTACRVAPCAGGRVTVTIAYDGRNAAGRASGVEIALVAGGVADWDNILQTVAIAQAAARAVTLDAVFAHGRIVRLAVRAVTTAGDAGDAAHLRPVVADASAPDPVVFMTGRQLS